MSKIKCPECEGSLELPPEIISAGLPKVRCSSCGCRFQVFSGGATAALSQESMGRSHSGSGASGDSRSSSGYSSRSSYDGGPNLSVAGSPSGMSSGSVNAEPMSGGGAGFSYPELEPGVVFRGKWRIESELGRGGTAVVYRAWDLDADLSVALKVVGVVGDQAEELRRSWAEEYKARRKVADGRHLLALESPALEEREGVSYVALPQELGGKTLRQWLGETKKDLEGREDEGLEIFDHICRGVEALHQAGIAHLDLKPENVLLVSEKQRIVAKVGDFGLARASGSMGRREGAGTPAYMAPEQVRSAREKEIGPWSDIYALGCILFEILDGDTPFSGTSEALKKKHLEMEPPDLLGASSHLEQLVRSCLAKKRSERPVSVTAVRESVFVDPAEQAAYAEAQRSNSEAGWRAFLNDWANGHYAESVRRELEVLINQREAAEAERKRKAELEAEAARKRKAEAEAEAERQRLEKAERERKAAEERKRKKVQQAEAERKREAEVERRCKEEANAEVDRLIKRVEKRELLPSRAEPAYTELIGKADPNRLSVLKSKIDELRRILALESETGMRKYRFDQRRNVVIFVVSFLLYCALCYFLRSHLFFEGLNFKIVAGVLSAIVVGSVAWYVYVAYPSYYSYWRMSTRSQRRVRYGIFPFVLLLPPLLLVVWNHYEDVLTGTSFSEAVSGKETTRLILGSISGAILFASLAWYAYLAWKDGDFLYWKMLRSTRGKAKFALGVGVISAIALSFMLFDGGAEVSSATVTESAVVSSATSVFSSIKESFSRFDEAAVWKKMFTLSYYTKDAPALGILNHSLVCFILLFLVGCAAAISQGDSIIPDGLMISLVLFAGIFLLSAASLLFEPIGYLQAAKILMSTIIALGVIAVIGLVSNN